MKGKKIFFIILGMIVLGAIGSSMEDSKINDTMNAEEKINNEKLELFEPYVVKDFWKVAKHRGYHVDMEWELESKKLTEHPYSIKRRRAEGIEWDYEIRYRYTGWDSWTDNITLTYYFTEDGKLTDHQFFSYGDLVRLSATYNIK